VTRVITRRTPAVTSTGRPGRPLWPVPALRRVWPTLDTVSAAVNVCKRSLGWINYDNYVHITQTKRIICT